ncbi:MAG: glycosyltransferase family 39 protein [Prolixibacteraceae bacterium]
MKFKRHYLPIVLILLVASALRFYKFAELPFTADEFSTVFRLHYDSLSDVIQIGMKELDNHPIGTQVFYYYYTHLFGEGEMAVKLPIILFGIFSVFMVFRLGKRWFGSSSGLFAASFMAVLQYSIAQSEIARMYGFGIPFILLMVDFWDKMLHEKFSFKNAAFFVLFASLCIYTHYFALLFAAIVGLSGLFLVKKENFIKYVLAGIAIVLLFLPTLNIFLYQLSKGGIEGWLGPFTFFYFFTYISYVFHHSWFVAGVLLVPMLLFFTFKLNKEANRYRYLSLIWFLTPMLFGFIYSYYVNNVTHERVLYFSFPFLLLFLASFIRKVDLKREMAMVLSILLVGTVSLFVERNHYKLFVKHRFKMVAESLVEWEKEIGSNDVLSVKFTREKIDRYYNKKYNFQDTTAVYLNAKSDIKDFIHLLENSTQEYLYFGRADIIDQTFLQLALSYYPVMLKKSYTYAGEVYLLKRGIGQFEWPCISWNYLKTFEPTKEDQSKNLNGLISNETYFGTIDALLDTLIFSKNNFIELSMNMMSLDTIDGAMLVASIEKDGELLDWRGISVDQFIEKDSVFYEAMFTIPFPDIKYSDNCRIKFMLWNRQGASYCIQNFKLITRAGNPYIYGFIDKIPFDKSSYCLSD